MKTTIPLLAALLVSTVSHAAQDGCTAFKWDVAAEVTLFRTAATVGAIAGQSATNAPTVEVGRLYAVTLVPEESVKFDAPASKRMLKDGASGGLLRLRASVAGRYRISVDSGVWLDVARDGKALDSVDFNGRTECNGGPTKIVVYDLPAGTDLLIQIGAAESARTRLAVTRVDSTAS